jgi:streptogramin lyase
LALSIRIAAAEPAEKEKPQGLWVGSENYISEFQGPALEQSGTPSTNLAFRIKDYLLPTSITFDRHNNLWVTSLGTDPQGLFPIIEIGRADEASHESGKLMKGKVIIPGKGFGDTASVSLAFDAAGDLWVVNLAKQAIMKFRPNQIEKSGAPSPKILITSPVFFPGAMRFDASDNLWVAAGNQQLWRFAPGDRAVSGFPNPGLNVDLPDGLVPVDFGFDSSGNLWLAGSSSDGDALEMISAGDLTGSGEISPSAAVIITSSAFGVSDSDGTCLGGMDFDHSGDLWVSVQCDPDTQVVEFTPSQLTTGGSLTPSVTIGQNSTGTNLFFPGPIRFGPSLK